MVLHAMEAQPVKRRLAILAANAAGYSRLMGAEEEGTHAHLETHRRELIDPMLAEHHRHVIRLTGDGIGIAARLEEALAEPGGVLIFGAAYDQIANDLDYGDRFLGEQRIKYIAKGNRVRNGPPHLMGFASRCCGANGR
jgi:class 3 adenylate cyclase